MTSTSVSASTISVLRGMRTKPSARLNAVTLPLPLPIGYAASAPSDAGPGSAPARATSPTSRYSRRPRSERVLSARRARTLSRRCGARPAISRIAGATNSWKVKTAEVGKPGRITTGRSPLAARQIGLPGLSATPCTITPGESSPTTRLFRSPSPFDVPPESSTRSALARARWRASRTARSSSRKTPRKSATAPSSRTASARIRLLLS